MAVWPAVTMNATSGQGWCKHLLAQDHLGAHMCHHEGRLGWLGDSGWRMGAVAPASRGLSCPRVLSPLGFRGPAWRFFVVGRANGAAPVPPPAQADDIQDPH